MTTFARIARACLLARRMIAAGATLAVVLIAGLAGLAWTPSSAQAADLSQFQPGRIISDAVFYDSSSMSAGAIDAFLDAKGASCRAGAMPCLKDYTQTTWSIAGDAKCPGGYVGAANESVGTIVAKVAQSCGINPQVLVVMLQKEQGLVTISAPSASRYDKAMGFACPDTGNGCDPAYSGFFAQVYKAAWQLRNYTLNPTKYNYRAGRTNTILYNPNQACGSANVYIDNQATANLYIYTPYTPNAAALAAGYGSGDGCSSYGNRNFYNYFNDWFGPSWDRPPFGHIDSTTTTSSSITVSGWALDPDTTAPIMVHLYLDGGWMSAVSADQDRPDVDAVYGRGSAHGFTATVPASPGVHQVCVWGINDWPAGGNPIVGCQTVTVVDRQPVGALERVELTAAGLEVSGWAYDPDVAGPAPVSVTVDGTAHVISASGARTDVPGRSGPSGFDVTLQPGTGSHRVCVQVADDVTGSTDLGCRDVTVAPAVSPVVGTGIVPVNPSRVLDTWVSSPTQGPRCFALTAAGVPSNATGAYVNLTAVHATSPGNIVVYPESGTVPGATTVHLEPGVDVATGTWVGLSAGARMCWSGQGGGPVELLADVSAFTTSGSSLVTQTPQRVIDTRFGVGTGSLAPHTVATVPVAGHGGVPVGARAAVVSVAVIGPTGPGNLRLFAAGASTPGVATVNYAVGQNKSNSAIVPLGAGGALALYSDTFAGPVNVIVDVTGYIGATGSDYTPTTPTRLLDTRADGSLHTLTAGQRVDLNVRRAGIVPAGATAVVVNVTAVQPSGPGNLRVFADGGGVAALPNASTVNYIPGRDIGNLVVVAIGADGMVGLYDDQVPGSRVDVTADLVGYVGG